MNWFEERKQKWEIADLQAELDHINKMYSDHDAEIERMTRDSEQRIADYQQAANDQIAAARTQSFDNNADENPGFNQFEEPGTDENEMAQELINRMD